MKPSLSVRTLHQLQNMAKKLQDNPSYMAWIISVYQKQERLSLQNLLNILCTNEGALAKLALCKKPNSNSSEFSKQVQQISTFTNIAPLTLAKLIRQSESVTALTGRYSKNSELRTSATQLGLAAARDRTIEDRTDEDSEDKSDVAER